MVGSLAGQVTAGTKVVLTTKMGTPVTFQQNKNFQQSFATWVKQGQTTQGTAASTRPVRWGSEALCFTAVSLGNKHSYNNNCVATHPWVRVGLLYHYQ